MPGGEGLERGRPEERQIPGDDEHVAGAGGAERGSRGQDRVARASALPLDGDGHAPGRRVPGHGLAVMTGHDHDGSRLEGLHRVQDQSEHGFPQQGMEDLVRSRTEARPFASGQDNRHQGFGHVRRCG
jgi:hypothetical protein